MGPSSVKNGCRSSCFAMGMMDPWNLRTNAQPERWTVCPLLSTRKGQQQQAHHPGDGRAPSQPTSILLNDNHFAMSKHDSIKRCH